jgi:Collagen triple helix repeat (20 copies)
MGPMGQQGLQGVPGENGQPGAPGRDGLDGLPGKDGKDGLNGANGLNGKDGKDGLNGKDGKDGLPGAQGVPGSQGPMGNQGLQGVPGDCVTCPCNCPAPEYANVYSLLFQDLVASPGLNLAGQVILFEQSIVASPGIDISQAGVSGKFTINRAGWYDVSIGVCANLNPLSAPLEVWTVSLFKNGVLVPGSTNPNMTLSPEQRANDVSSDTYVHFSAGDVLEVANTSTNVLHLTAPALGTNAPSNSAYLKLNLLKAD